MTNLHFAFGKNWNNFVKRIDEERIIDAEKSITPFLGIKDILDTILCSIQYLPNKDLSAYN